MIETAVATGPDRHRRHLRHRRARPPAPTRARRPSSAPRGVMCLPPVALRRRPRTSWSPTSPRVAAATDLPIMLYNNPEAARSDLRPATIARIGRGGRRASSPSRSAAATRAGSRTSSSSPATASTCSSAATTGRSRATPRAPSAGCPASPTSRPRSAWSSSGSSRAGDLAAARALWPRLAPLSRLDMDPRLVQSFKAALDLQGRYGGPTRPPRLPLSDAEHGSASCRPMRALDDGARVTTIAVPRHRGDRVRGRADRRGGRARARRRVRARRSAAGPARRARPRRASSRPPPRASPPTPSCVDLIVSDVGKPVTEARAEVAPRGEDPALRRVARLPARRRGLRGRHRRARARRARPARRRAADHAVELPRRDPGLEARARAAGRQRRRPQAGDARRCGSPQRLAEHLDLGDVLQLVPGGASTANALLDAGARRRLLHRLDRRRPLDPRAPGRAASSRCSSRWAARTASTSSEHADPALAAKVALGGAMGYAGQKCTATSLLFVHERAADAVRDRARSPGRRAADAATRADDATVVGPLIEPAKRDEVAEQLAAARDRGVEIAARRRAAGPARRVPRPHRARRRRARRPRQPRGAVRARAVASRRSPASTRRSRA